MKTELGNQLQSDRKLSDKQVIGTQIFDANMPSEISFQSPTKSKNKNKNYESNAQKNMNPQQAGVPEYRDGIIVLKQFNVRGKGIFENDVILVKDKKFSVKLLNEQDKGLWQSVVGYCKRQLIIEDGQVYITQSIKNQNILKSAYKLTNLMKIFADPEQNSFRLVFRCEDKPKMRITKDFQTQQLVALMQKLLLECNVVGLEVIPDDF